MTGTAVGKAVAPADLGRVVVAAAEVVLTRAATRAAVYFMLAVEELESNIRRLECSLLRNWVDRDEITWQMMIKRVRVRD